MIAVKLELHALLNVRLLLKTKTLLNQKIWEWSAKPINMELFSIGDAEPDTSSPNFKKIAQDVCFSWISK